MNSNKIKNQISILENEGLDRFGLINLDGELKKLQLDTLQSYSYIINRIMKLTLEQRKFWIKKQNQFDEEYFERGIQNHKSGYENFRWMPELTIRMAHYMITDLPITRQQKVLDFGCAKGYLVKALRMLGIDAYGADISLYAIQSVASDRWNTQNCCKLIFDWKIPFDNIKFDWVIAKDCIEHLTEDEMIKFLQITRSITKKLFVVSPLGYTENQKEKFIIESYEGDVTHIIRKPVKWWLETFKKNNWAVKKFTYTMPPIKENWTDPYPHGNGFYILE